MNNNALLIIIIILCLLIIVTAEYGDKCRGDESNEVQGNSEGIIIITDVAW